MTDIFAEESRCLAFVRFPSLEEAKDFVEKNSPTVYLRSRTSTENGNEAAKVRIAYSRERGDRAAEKGGGGSDWTCKIV